jgi:hypothetical protein
MRIDVRAAEVQDRVLGRYSRDTSMRELVMNDFTQFRLGVCAVVAGNGRSRPDLPTNFLAPARIAQPKPVDQFVARRDLSSKARAERSVSEPLITSLDSCWSCAYQEATSSIHEVGGPIVN